MELFRFHAGFLFAVFHDVIRERLSPTVAWY